MAALAEGVRTGQIVAFYDDNDQVMYVHPTYATPEQLANQLSAEQVEAALDAELDTMKP